MENVEGWWCVLPLFVGFSLQLFFPFLVVDCSFFLAHVLPLILLLLHFLSLCLLCNSLFGFFLLILLENVRYVVPFRFPVFFHFQMQKLVWCLYVISVPCDLFVLFFFFLWIFDVYLLLLMLMSVHLLFFLSRTKLMLGTGLIFRLFFVKLWFVILHSPLHIFLVCFIYCCLWVAILHYYCLFWY